MNQVLKDNLSKAVASFTEHEGFRHNLNRTEDFNFPDFSHYFLSHFKTTADAIISIYSSENHDEIRISEKYLDELSRSKYWTRVVIAEILAEFDQFNNKSETEKSIELLRTDQRFSGFFADKEQESIAMSWHRTVSNKALWILADKAKFGKTALVKTTHNDHTLRLSWVSLLTKNCNNSAEECDFILSKIFFHMKDGKHNSLNVNRDNILDVISESNSDKLKSGYIHILEWMKKNGMHNIYDSHLPTIWHTRKKDSTYQWRDDLSSYIECLVDKGHVQPRFFEDLIDLDRIEHQHITAYYEAGLRFRLKFTATEVDNMVACDNHSVIYAIYSQQRCAMYKSIDFRTLFNKCFSDKVDLEIAAKSITGSLSKSEAYRQMMWEKAVDEICAEKIQKEKSNFIKFIVLGFPLVEIAKFSAKYLSDENYTFIDKASSTAAIGVWIATLALTQEGKSAWAYLRKNFKHMCRFLSQKTMDVASSICSGIVGEISAAMGKLWSTLGMLDPDNNQINEPGKAEDVFPETKKLLWKMHYNEIQEDIEEKVFR
ncbi:hypothetical protein IFT69_17545 [Pseudomonas putida]|nr:hypothetical protein [Pseudomonas putida]